MLMAAGDVMIEVRDLVKEFGSIRALDRVNLTVCSGRVVVIIGPSGSDRKSVV